MHPATVDIRLEPREGKGSRCGIGGITLLPDRPTPSLPSFLIKLMQMDLKCQKILLSF